MNIQCNYTKNFFWLLNVFDNYMWGTNLHFSYTVTESEVRGINLDPSLQLAANPNPECVFFFLIDNTEPSRFHQGGQVFWTRLF